ncbi:hypothetical protein GYH30_033827 [Glycine max]|nr:hypothetical protein GYH30_033827 [Glycine max]
MDSLFPSSQVKLPHLISVKLDDTDHCASMVPNSNPNESKFKDFPHGQFQVGYYLGGDKIVGADTFQKLRQKQVTLRIKSVYETDVSGLLKVGATLLIRSASSYYRVGNFTRGKRLKNRKRFPSSIMFSLDGFWAESSGRLCMVGTGSGYSMQLLEVVLKLYNVVNSSNTISTLVIGSLESLSSKNELSYFEPILLFIFPKMDYEYSLDTMETKNEYSDEGEVVPGLSINPVSFCANIFPMINGKYGLHYQKLVCLDVKQRVIELIGFRNSGDRWSFNPNTTLVGEGWWDEEKNQLSIVGCHFLGMEDSMASVHVGDCSTRMILRFLKIWSIKDASSIVGDSGYFKRVVLRKFGGQRVQISGTQYEYSQLDKVRKMCLRQEPLKNKEIRYPDVYSSDMRFDMSVRISKRRVAWALACSKLAKKININLQPNAMLGDDKSILNRIANVNEPMNVSAVDCEVIVMFQFPPLDAKNNGGYIKGSIESMREKSNPLYFKQLDVISAAFYTAEASQILKKIDMEKTTKPNTPLISLVMLLILTLGNMVPLVLNFEALFAKNHDKKSILLGNEWLEVNEIAVRIIVMAAFLLQLHLLQLTWSTRKADTKQKDLWIAEKKVLHVIFTLYAVGILIALLVHQNNTLHGDVVYSSSLSQQHSFWEHLKSCSGLVLDDFLLPQILLNIFMNSKGNALSCSFYFGTSLVRLIPHAYDLFEALAYVDGSCLYADEIADYYSTAWDIIIPLVSLMFASIIHFQQRFGGCSILSWRIKTKGVEEYEKVPMVTEA